MPVKMKPTSEIVASLGLNPTGKVQKFFTHTCRIHMDKYVPYDTGTLSKTVEERDTYIVYDQNYAKVVYGGIRKGKSLNYKTDKHKLAGPYWDKRMVSAEIDDVISEVQNHIKRGK